MRPAATTTSNLLPSIPSENIVYITLSLHKCSEFFWWNPAADFSSAPLDRHELSARVADEDDRLFCTKFCTAVLFFRLFCTKRQMLPALCIVNASRPTSHSSIY